MQRCLSAAQSWQGRMAIEIYLVRHGETEWHAQGRYEGKLDSPLTRRGRKQARDVGRFLSLILKGRGNIALHISPLGRARETAESIGDFIEATSIVEPRIGEVSIGAWDGLTHTDMHAGWPGRLKGCSAYDWFFRAPDGESYKDALGRVSTWLKELRFFADWAAKKGPLRGSLKSRRQYLYYARHGRRAEHSLSGSHERQL